jgi:hypothetical protein
MASLGQVLGRIVLVASALAGNVQFVMQREAQSGKVWFRFGVILPNEI